MADGIPEEKVEIVAGPDEGEADEVGPIGKDGRASERIGLTVLMEASVDGLAFGPDDAFAEGGVHFRGLKIGGGGQKRLGGGGDIGEDASGIPSGDGAIVVVLTEEPGRAGFRFRCDEKSEGVNDGIVAHDGDGLDGIGGDADGGGAGVDVDARGFVFVGGVEDEVAGRDEVVEGSEIELPVPTGPGVEGVDVEGLTDAGVGHHALSGDAIHGPEEVELGIVEADAKRAAAVVGGGYEGGYGIFVRELAAKGEALMGGEHRLIVCVRRTPAFHRPPPCADV